MKSYLLRSVIARSVSDKMWREIKSIPGIAGILPAIPYAMILPALQPLQDGEFFLFISGWKTQK